MLVDFSCFHVECFDIYVTSFQTPDWHGRWTSPVSKFEISISYGSSWPQGDPGVELVNGPARLDGEILPMIAARFSLKKIGWWNFHPFSQIEFVEDDIFILFTSVLGAYGFEIALRGILLDVKTGSWMCFAAPFVLWNREVLLCTVAVEAEQDDVIDEEK